MSIANALDHVCQHREVVLAYFHRASRSRIVTGVAKTNGGAVVVDKSGQFARSFPTRAAALHALSSN